MKELVVLVKQFETTECHLSSFFRNNVATNLEVDLHQRLNCFQRSILKNGKISWLFQEREVLGDYEKKLRDNEK